jgi:hypothetical protein
VAANRDEYLSRPAEGPALRKNAGRTIVAPLDLSAGGTWLGVNQAGVFGALTNIRNPNPDPARKSRGLVVMELLESGSAAEAASRLGELPERTYNPFNLFVADAESAHLLVYQNAPRLHELEPGVHVIGNADAGEAAVPKVKRVLERAIEALGASVAPESESGYKSGKGGSESGESRDLLLEALAGVCREHGSGPNPLDDTCVHVEDTYGTRSSVLLELADRHHESRLLYADGPPCKTQYEDFSSLLSELRQTPGYGSTEILTRTAS